MKSPLDLKCCVREYNFTHIVTSMQIKYSRHRILSILKQILVYEVNSEDYHKPIEDAPDKSFCFFLKTFLNQVKKELECFNEDVQQPDIKSDY